MRHVERQAVRGRIPRNRATGPRLRRKGGKIRTSRKRRRSPPHGIRISPYLTILRNSAPTGTGTRSIKPPTTSDTSTTRPVTRWTGTRGNPESLVGRAKVIGITFRGARNRNHNDIIPPGVQSRNTHLSRWLLAWPWGLYKPLLIQLLIGFLWPLRFRGTLYARGGVELRGSEC